MHVFLVVCVLVQFIALVILALRSRSHASGNEFLSGRIDDVISELEELRKDSDVSALTASIQDLSEAHADDVKGIGERITDLSDRLELMRRKASVRTGAGSFESMRSRAELGATQGQQMPRSELVALAEGK